MPTPRDVDISDAETLELTIPKFPSLDSVT